MHEQRWCNLSCLYMVMQVCASVPEYMCLWVHECEYVRMLASMCVCLRAFRREPIVEIPQWELTMSFPAEHSLSILNHSTVQSSVPFFLWHYCSLPITFVQTDLPILTLVSLHRSHIRSYPGKALPCKHTDTYTSHTYCSCPCMCPHVHAHTHKHAVSY